MPSKYANEQERKAARYAAFKRYRAKNQDKYRALHRASYHRNRDANVLYNRRFRLRSAFGLSVAQYEQLLISQGGGCAICAGSNPSGKRLAVDHSHDSGKIRGLLCSRCNTMLGHSREQVSILQQAIAYLLREKAH
jgi:hypothetical protein